MTGEEILRMAAIIAREYVPPDHEHFEDVAQHVAMGIIESGATDPPLAHVIGRRRAVDYWRRLNRVSVGGSGRIRRPRKQTVEFKEEFGDAHTEAPNMAAMIDFARNPKPPSRDRDYYYAKYTLDEACEILTRMAYSPLHSSDQGPNNARSNYGRYILPSGFTPRSWY